MTFALRLHSKKKNTSEHLFWCFRLSQIEDSIQYLEGTNSTWKDHDKNLGVQMVLPGTIWSFQVLNRSSICDNLKHQKRGSEVLFFLECIKIWYITTCWCKRTYLKLLIATCWEYHYSLYSMNFCTLQLETNTQLQMTEYMEGVIWLPIIVNVL